MQISPIEFNHHTAQKFLTSIPEMGQAQEKQIQIAQKKNLEEQKNILKIQNEKLNLKLEEISRKYQEKTQQLNRKFLEKQQIVKQRQSKQIKLLDEIKAKESQMNNLSIQFRSEIKSKEDKIKEILKESQMIKSEMKKITSKNQQYIFQNQCAQRLSGRIVRAVQTLTNQDMTSEKFLRIMDKMLSKLKEYIQDYKKETKKQTINYINDSKNNISFDLGNSSEQQPLVSSKNILKRSKQKKFYQIGVNTSQQKIPQNQSKLPKNRIFTNSETKYSESSHKIEEKRKLIIQQKLPDSDKAMLEQKKIDHSIGIIVDSMQLKNGDKEKHSKSQRSSQKQFVTDKLLNEQIQMKYKATKSSEGNINNIITKKKQQHFICSVCLSNKKQKAHQQMKQVPAQIKEQYNSMDFQVKKVNQLQSKPIFQFGKYCNHAVFKAYEITIQSSKVGNQKQRRLNLKKKNSQILDAQKACEVKNNSPNNQSAQRQKYTKQNQGKQYVNKLQRENEINQKQKSRQEKIAKITNSKVPHQNGHPQNAQSSFVYKQEKSKLKNIQDGVRNNRLGIIASNAVHQQQYSGQNSSKPPLMLQFSMSSSSQFNSPNREENILKFNLAESKIKNNSKLSINKQIQDILNIDKQALQIGVEPKYVEMMKQKYNRLQNDEDILDFYELYKRYTQAVKCLQKAQQLNKWHELRFQKFIQNIEKRKQINETYSLQQQNYHLTRQVLHQKQLLHDQADEFQHNFTRHIRQSERAINSQLKMLRSQFVVESPKKNKIL